jgi:hypothetical protein
MRQKAERGWYPTMRLPIGYVHKPGYVLGAEDEIIPNDKQFRILRKLWDILLTGKYSIADIKRKGDTLGLRNKFNKKCAKGAYYTFFTNEFYCGYYHWKDKDDNLIRYKGKHKMMVSPAEFQKAQILLQDKPNSVSRVKKYDFPYRGIIKCGECGCAVTPDHKLQAICTSCKCKYSIKSSGDCPKCRAKFSEMENPSVVDILYYHCTRSRGICSQGSIRKELIDNSIEEELKKISINKCFYSWAMNGLKNGNENKEEAENIIKSLMKKKTELENRISNLVILRADGEIDSEQFSLSVSKAEKEISSFEFEIGEAKKQNIEWYDNKIRDLNFALEAYQKFKNGDDSLKMDMLKELASNITLSDKKLDITVKEPLLEIEKCYSDYCQKNDASNLLLPLYSKDIK